MPTSLLPATVLLLAAARLSAAQPPSIDEIAPSLTQLGPGWTTNYTVFCVDQMHPTNPICNDSKGWLQIAHKVVGKAGCQAYAYLRYLSETNQVSLWVWRYQSQAHLPKRQEDAQPTLKLAPPLPVGDELNLYREPWPDPTITLAFRRGPYLVNVRGWPTCLERLKKIAVVMDGNLVKTLGQPTLKNSMPRS